MLGFIKRLFVGNSDDCLPQPDGAFEPMSGSSATPREHVATNSYFGTMSRMQAAVSKRDYDGGALLVRENLTYIPQWVKETRQQFGSFDIPSIPALQQGGKVLALVGDDEGLARMREVVHGTPELEPWAANIEEHHHDLKLFKAIREAVELQPRCLQSDIKHLVGESDGRRVANLISYLEKAGSIVRIKEGRTYRLVCAGLLTIPTAPPAQTVRSHRVDSKPPELHEINISSLSYVPLPRSPLRWDETQARRGKVSVPEATDHFEVRDADWRIASIDMIPLAQRPDPAFRQFHPNNAGLVMIDDLGKAEGFDSFQSSALRYDRIGNLSVKAALRHGVYRVGVHPFGQGLIAMSSDCIVHAYDDELTPTLETALDQAPEIQALRRRFEIGDEQLKNHIRCVALSRMAERYLFTVVDQAWCVNMRGQGLWGAKLPIKEGWTRIASPSTNLGTSDEVDNALALMDLSMPVTPEGVKRRYRELAKRYHPDLNPGDAQSEEKMKAVNLATEVLTGVDVSALPVYTDTDARFIREMGRTEFEVGGLNFTISMEMSGSEISASDWIYAASFAADSDSVYLAGYSGRVLLVDHNGNGVRAYDVGSVPRRIIDTGDYLYLLTDTRLYVLRDDALHALVDTFDGGDLVVAQTGFGLIEKRRLRWFREDGHYLGSVVSKDPIRRVYSDGDAMIVETRQRRTVIRGAPTWWERDGG